MTINCVLHQMHHGFACWWTWRCHVWGQPPCGYCTEMFIIPYQQVPSSLARHFWDVNSMLEASYLSFCWFIWFIPHLVVYVVWLSPFCVASVANSIRVKFLQHFILKKQAKTSVHVFPSSCPIFSIGRSFRISSISQRSPSHEVCPQQPRGLCGTNVGTVAASQVIPGPIGPCDVEFGCSEDGPWLW